MYNDYVQHWYFCSLSQGQRLLNINNKQLLLVAYKTFCQSFFSLVRATHLFTLIKYIYKNFNTFISR